MNLALMPSCFICLSIGPATASHTTEEHHVGLLGLDLGQDGVEVGGLVVGELAIDDFTASSLDALLELVSHALTVGGAVVDDGDLLAAEILDRVTGQRGRPGACHPPPCEKRC
jgi:hypothetical protein